MLITALLQALCVYLYTEFLSTFYTKNVRVLHVKKKNNTSHYLIISVFIFTLVNNHNLWYLLKWIIYIHSPGGIVMTFKIYILYANIRVKFHVEIKRRLKFINLSYSRFMHVRTKQCLTGPWTLPWDILLIFLKP